MKRMKRMKGSRAFMALFLAVVMILGNALAGTYYIEDGDVVVHASENSQTVRQADNTQNDNAPVISNKNPETSSANTVTIISDKGCTASVTVKDLNIDVRAKDGTPAVKTEGAGDVNIELDGNISLKSGAGSAGLQKENTGNLTINDADHDGKLEAIGGEGGAGIGSNDNYYSINRSVDNITINGGEIIATSGMNGAGIGGGSGTDCDNITINGGKITATGNGFGAGIGGGSSSKYTKGNGSNITINGGEVTATSTVSGAGIGGGEGEGENITINGGTVIAISNTLGAGIGGGYDSDGKDIAIKGGVVIATGGIGGAGIGGGGCATDCGGSGEDVQISGSAQVKVAGGKSSGRLGNGAAIGDGGGYDGQSIDGTELQFQASDLTCGSIEYYAPGTSAEDIQNSTVDPEETVKGTKGHDVNSSWTGNSKTHWHTCSEPGCAARIDEATHTPAGAVKENEKPAQAGKAGSYDEVIYCSVCHRELSRKTVTTAPLRDNKKMPQGNLAALCAEMAKQIRQAPENGTVEMDAGSFDGLTRVVFKALGERPDVTLKLQTKEGMITIPAGAGLLEKIGGKNTVSFAELKDMLK